ncbi:MAG: riboflavin synthase [Acidobacteriaceae bacterium]
MFTGLIERTGTVLSVEDGGGARRIRVQARGVATRLREGDSIAVSGVCLTALAITEDGFEADLAEETVRRTSLTRLAPGSVVNLELPTPAGTPLGGHVVQGHVDGTGTVRSLAPVAAAGGDWWLEVETPENVARYVVEKGSIAIEGISLTVARWDGRTAGVAIIPHTYAQTNLSTLKAGDLVNLEADVLMKYAESARRFGNELGSRSGSSELSLAYLIENGY